jgi:hypothetical protein
MNSGHDSGGPRNFGRAWVFLCVALCAHVTDEALTGFLPLYNATVLAMHSEYKWYPMPTFGYREWLLGLITANVLLLLLTPFAYRNAHYLRPFAYLFAAIMLLNGLGHTLATIFGRTASSVPIPRPAPGFYSSPLLFAGSIYLLIRLRASRRSQAADSGQRMPQA